MAMCLNAWCGSRTREPERAPITQRCCDHRPHQEAIYGIGMTGLEWHDLVFYRAHQKLEKRPHKCAPAVPVTGGNKNHEQKIARLTRRIAPQPRRWPPPTEPPTAWPGGSETCTWTEYSLPAETQTSATTSGVKQKGSQRPKDVEVVGPDEKQSTGWTYIVWRAILPGHIRL